MYIHTDIPFHFALIYEIYRYTLYVCVYNLCIYIHRMIYCRMMYIDYKHLKKLVTVLNDSNILSNVLTSQSAKQ